MRLFIAGVGLIGGSLALSLKENFKDRIFITGYGRNENNLEIAKKLGVIDNIASDLECVKDNDIIYLSTPVMQMLPIVEKMMPYLKEGTIITDGGSTKGEIFNEIKKLLPKNVYYIAGHPMTGREKSGITAAQANLFKNKTYVIIKDESVPQNIYDKLMYVLEKIGARFYYLPITAHDSAASIISHVPHVAAAALVHLLKNSENKDIAKNLIGGGFIDTTRIGSSNADMWADILMTNSGCILKDLDRYIEILSKVRESILKKDRDELFGFFADSKAARDNLLAEVFKA